MIARGFKPVLWVGAVGGAALGCYMLSLNVAAERSELARIERQIVAAKQDIRALNTELGTRGRLQQLEHWNADVLALSAPGATQFAPSAYRLATFDQPQPSFTDRAQVRMAAAEATPVPGAPPRPIQASAFKPDAAAPGPTPSLVRKASVTVADAAAAAPSVPKRGPASAPAPRKPSLLDGALARDIAAAEAGEKVAAPGAR